MADDEPSYLVGEQALARKKAISKYVLLQPKAVWWKRLPIIRHIRYIILTGHMTKHYERHRSIGRIPVNIDYDIAVLKAVKKGIL